MKAAKLKKFPILKTDEEAERFVDEADLSEYDFSDMVPLAEFEERRAGRPSLGEKAKQHISLRLDPDVIAKFKGTGKGWQGRINDALSEAKVPGPWMGRVSRPSPAAVVAAKPAAGKLVVGRKAASAGKIAAAHAGKIAAAPAAKKAAAAPAKKAAAAPAAKKAAAKAGHQRPTAMQFRRKG